MLDGCGIAYYCSIGRIIHLRMLGQDFDGEGPCLGFLNISWVMAVYLCGQVVRVLYL